MRPCADVSSHRRTPTSWKDLILSSIDAPRCDARDRTERAPEVMQGCHASPTFALTRARACFLGAGTWLWSIGPCGGCEGLMDELIGRLVANTGVDRAAAEKAVGIILQFLLKEGPADKVKALIDKLPGAEAAIAAAPADTGGGGIFGGGLMAAGTRLMAAGLSMGQVQGVTRETIGYA